MKRFLIINWGLVLCGISMVAWFINPPSWDILMSLLFLWNIGPYLLLGLGGHLAREKSRIRWLYLMLLIILLVVPGWFYTFVSKDAQGGFIFLSLPLFMWIFSAIALVFIATYNAESSYEDGKDA